MSLSEKLVRLPKKWFIAFVAVGTISIQTASAQGPEICNGAMGGESSTFVDHPLYKGQEIKVVEIEPTGLDEVSPIQVGGTETAVQYVHPALAIVKPVIDRLVGASLPGIEISTGITGSLARYGLFLSANDIDIETQLILGMDRGNPNDLFNPRSSAIRKVGQYLKQHVEKTLAENPTYRFIELKAGEYLDPVTGEMQGIKWWLEDLRRGYKTIVESTGSRRISLAQALAEPARVKIDWAVPAVLDALNPFDYVEASVVYRLGMRVKNNQARLRISDDMSKNERLPISPTSLALSKEDLASMIEVSVGENPITIEGVHQALMKTIRKYQGVDQLKVVRRIFALLAFWESVPDYVELTGHQITKNELLQQFQKILTTSQILTLSRIKARTEIRQIAREHEVVLPTSDVEWMRLVKLDFGLTGNNLDELMADVKVRIEREMDALLQRFPDVKGYVDFVSQRAPFVIDQSLSKNAVFLVIKPKEEFLKGLSRKITGWKKKYPALQFINPQDAHLTVHFTGRLSDKAMDQLIVAAETQEKSIGSSGTALSEISLNGGGIHIMGKSSQVLAIKFPKDVLLSQVSQHLRAQAGAVGAIPEKTFLDFTPHVTIARMTSHSAETQKQARAFLNESTGSLSAIGFDGFEIWTRDESAESGISDPEYRRIR